jgi:serine protease Do
MRFTRKAFFAGAVAGVGVAAAAGAGIGLALPAASASGAGQNVSREISAPSRVAAPGAPASFADIFERVAPAVVSINVTSRLTGADAAELNGLPFPFNQMPQFQNPGRGGRGAPVPKRKSAPDSQDGDDGDAPEAQASGSGFFISPEGYIVTNNHVIDKATSITVVLNDKRELKAKLIGKDEDADLAVIKVEGRNFPYAQFETQTKPRVGDWVLAVGNPFLLGGTATAGIVSALGRDLPPDTAGQFPVDYIQIDAPINRGNSGGPTFDVYGRVIGVNTAIYSQSGGSVGIGFAVPADTADSIVKQLIAGKKVSRGYLGATIQNISPDAAESLGIAPNSGALVTDVTPAGPGARGGLQAGDVVTALNGEKVTSSSSLTRLVANTPAGGAMRLDIRRNGKMQTITVTAGLRPSASQLNALEQGGAGAGPEKPVEKPGAALPAAIGMTFAPLDSAARAEFSIPAEVKGVVIDSVAPTSDAGRKGVKRGYVIVQVNQRPVSTPAEVVAAIAEAKAAGRPSVFMLINSAGRNVGLAIKLDAPKSAPGRTGDG